MGAHVFVDESKERAYLLAAAVLQPRDVTSARKEISALLEPGQRRLHFTKEHPRRRRKILATICEIAPHVTIYDGARFGKDHQSARRACLERIVDDIASMRAHRLVLERDESVFANDQRWLYARTHAVGCQDTLRYVHLKAYEESLLAIPDAVAWCWAKGGDWLRRADAIIDRVREV